ALLSITTAMLMFDSCVVGNVRFLNSSMTAFCPLLPRSGHQDVSSCSVNLDASGIENQACVQCHWKERNESLCYPSTGNRRQHCCCRAPNCNEKLMKDSILGWRTEQISNGSCLSANLRSVKGALEWTHNLPEECLEVPDNHVMCYIEVEYAFGLITGIRSGCLNNTKWDTLKAKAKFEPCSTEHQQWNSTHGVGICCGGGNCISKLYRQSVFRELQRTRLTDEYAYAKLVELETTKKTEHIWATDQTYLSAQTIFEVLTCLFTSIYLCGMYYIYVSYKPTNIEKRPYIPGMERY
ncbi:hypothetical protein V3C99_015192, partial [Haemonchus contortus]